MGSSTFGFQEFINKINQQKTAMNNAIDETLDESATECVAETQSRTPVKSGNLRRAWTRSQVKVEGNIHYVDITNPLEYAASIEDGHKQKVGRYVPAIGKKLKVAFVPGRHMLRDSLTITKAELPAKLQGKIGGLK